MTRKQRSTRKSLRLEDLEERLCLSSLPVGTSTTVPDAAVQARLTASYGQLPLSFEANKGQTDARVNFLSRGAGYSAFLTPTRAVLSLKQGDGGNVVAMKLVRASSTSHPVGLDKMAGVSNYLVGNDPSKWHTNIANYAKVGYQDVYRGIDLVYHGDQQQLEYDFVVKPGADPRAIRLAFAGAQGESIDAQGNLVLHTSGGDLVEHAPVAYQTKNGVRHTVASRFVIGRGGQVGFAVGHYDHSRALVIDPVSSLVYSTYLGGNGNDLGYAIAVDASGNAYVSGLTGSTNFPTQAPLQKKNAGSNDVFVTKLNTAGSALLYSTYLGGSGGQEMGLGIAVDGNGNAYVTGETDSPNFPTVNAFQKSFGGGVADAFVAKLNASGSGLLYSTYLGGSGVEDHYASGSINVGGIAVDGAGDAYVSGYTGSTNFPTKNALQATVGGAFLAKFNTNLSGDASLVYSTYLGNPNDTATGVAIDTAGDAYVTGQAGANFPTTVGAFQTTISGYAPGFVAKVNPTGSALVYSTYIGGTGGDTALGIAVDGAGDAYVTGVTTSTDFPTTAGAYQKTLAGSKDVFVTELNAMGSGLLYSTYLGGSGDDRGYAIALDSTGHAYVAGWTRSTDFPVASALQPAALGGGDDAFVAEIDPTQAGAASLVYSTYLGGSNNDRAYGIAVDGAGNAYVTGNTYGSFPTTTGAFQAKKAGNSSTTDAFISKIAFG